MPLVQILRPEKLPAYLTLIERLRRVIPLPRRVLPRRSPFPPLLLQARVSFNVGETLRISIESSNLIRRSILLFQDRKYYHRFFRDHIFYRWFDPRNRWGSAKKMKKKTAVNSDSLFRSV